MAPRTNDVYPVIMAGGSGTRFWPLSRSHTPKQFLALTSKRSMLEETQRRVSALAGPRAQFVVCGAAHAPRVKKFLKTLPAKNVLVEPQARNTAPAIALAVAHVSAVDPHGVLVVLPSDQHVTDIAGFEKTIRQAVEVAREGSIVTIGIEPTRPETGYGYIQVGAPLRGAAHQVARFVEKPDRVTAEQYLRSGDYLWNAGIFVFRADVMMLSFERYMPELFTALQTLTKAVGTRSYAKVLAREFAKMPATSIDYGVAEKAKNIAVVPGRFGWSDVGSFNALPEVRSTDASGNVAEGPDTYVIDSKGCVVIGKRRAVAVVGMTDVVVVETDDAVLVLPKDKCQDVRKVVEALKAKKRSALL